MVVASSSQTGKALSRYTATIGLQGTTPYSQSKPIDEVRPKDEKADEFDLRTWRNHMQVDGEGQVFIPAAAFKSCVYEMAAYRGEKIAGKGQHTYTKHFLAAVMCPENIPLFDGQGQPIMAAEVQCERLFLDANGKKNSGSRVWRHCPVIPEGWTASATLLVLDGLITPDKLEEYVGEAGLLIGMGRWRPRNGGSNGRYIIISFDVEEGILGH